jgi:hypothetical protein
MTLAGTEVQVEEARGEWAGAAPDERTVVDISSVAVGAQEDYSSMKKGHM